MDKMSLSLFFSRLGGPSSLSLSLYEGYSSPLIIFVVPCWTHFSSAGEPRAGRHIPGVSHQC